MGLLRSAGVSGWVCAELRLGGRCGNSRPWVGMPPWRLGMNEGADDFHDRFGVLLAFERHLVAPAFQASCTMLVR